MHTTHRIDVAAYRDDIVKYVTTLCRLWKVKRTDIDDIVQEAWAEILASIGSFRPEKGTFIQWACGVARNVTRRHVRDMKRYVEHFSEYHPNVDDHAAPEPSPERCVQRQQARCTITKAAEKLSTQQVDVLVSHALDDMSHGDIGEELGITEAASQKCYQRARNRLAQCITTETLAAMPPDGTSCNESLNHGVWQWPRLGRLSHYTGQITATVIAFLLFVPTIPAVQPHAAITGVIQFDSKAAMCQIDKHSAASDKPVVCPDLPRDRPESASLPSVPAVPAPKKFVDKPTPVQRSALPPYKYTASHSAHRPANVR